VQVTLWEIIERRRPFRDMDGFQIQTQVLIDRPLRETNWG
jgi:hypothetical protein